MANLLIERTQNTSWVVVFKALVTVHNLMNYGNEVGGLRVIGSFFFFMKLECKFIDDQLFETEKV